MFLLKHQVFKRSLPAQVGFTAAVLSKLQVLNSELIQM